MRRFLGMNRPLGGFFSDPAPADLERERTASRARERQERLADTLRTMDMLGRMLNPILRRMEKIMTTMDDVLQQVYDQRGQIESLAALTAGLKSRLEAAIASAGAINPAQQAQIDKVFAELDANRAAITKAINANDDDPSNDPQPEPVVTDPPVGEDTHVTPVPALPEDTQPAS